MSQTIRSTLGFHEASPTKVNVLAGGIPTTVCRNHQGFPSFRTETSIRLGCVRSRSPTFWAQPERQSWNPATATRAHRLLVQIDIRSLQKIALTVEPSQIRASHTCDKKPRHSIDQLSF